MRSHPSLSLTVLLFLAGCAEKDTISQPRPAETETQAATIQHSTPKRPLAFPGAEGFGAFSKGGRGGDVIRVENLNDDGPGSLRAAIASQKARTILFRVSGVIALRSPLEIKFPFVTIAGQSAPGAGICLKNFGLRIRTHDVIVRHLRIRPGDEPAAAFAKRGKEFTPDSISIMQPSHDVIIDHCSASWSVDECLSVSGEGITDVTVQWCIISESLNESVHPKGKHGFGSLLRCNGKLSFHHNIYAHHMNRSPRPGTYGDGSILLDFRNNVLYDTSGYSGEDPVRMNYVGNYVKRPRRYIFAVGGSSTRLFVQDNLVVGDQQASQDNWRIISGRKDSSQSKEPFQTAAVTTQSAETAAKSILESAGATLPQRDPIDQRVVAQIRSNKGDLIDSQRDVGGWPPYASTKAPTDTDRDGMPDAWEKQHDLDPANPDHNGNPDADGFTNLEEWLNGTDPERAD